MTSYTSKYPIWHLNLASKSTPAGSPDPDWYPNRVLSFATIGGTRTDPGPVPGFRQLIARGDNASTILGASRSSIHADLGDFYQKSRNKLTGDCVWHRTWGHNSWPSIPPEYWGAHAAIVTSVDNQAKMRFVQKALQTQSALSGTVFLGELAETLRMIRTPAQALRRGIDKYYRDLKRKRKGSKAQRLKAASDSWLEHAFGWNPLINDIESGASALANIAYRRLPFQMVEVTANGEYLVDTYNEDVSVSGGFFYRLVKENKANVGITYRGVVNLAIDNMFLMSAQNLGFRWDQFVPTLWELTPYSFLVDYFTNIGDVLSCWSYASSNLKWLYKTDRRTSTEDARAFNPRWAKSDATWERTTLANKPCSSHAEYKTVSRGPASSLVPSLALEIPGMSSLKWLNLAALAQSRLSMRPY